jgi:ABC-type uncharacterized transport system permease subunit
MKSRMRIYPQKRLINLRALKKSLSQLRILMNTMKKSIMLSMMQRSLIPKFREEKTVKMKTPSF